MNSSRLKFFIVLFFFFIFHIFSSIRHVFAAENISRIIVSGLYSMSKSEFLDVFGVEEGDDFERDLIRRGIKTAFLKGIFNDIRVSKEDTTLYIEVEERDFIEKINVSGNERFSDKEIKELFDFEEGMVFREDPFDLAIHHLKQSLSERGFPFAEVNTEIDKPKKPKRIKIHLRIHEGEPLIIKHIDVIGEKPELRELFDVSKNDIYNKIFLNKKMDDLKRKLKKDGYYHPVVGPYTYDEKTGLLNIFMDTGKKLKIVFKDTTVFSDKTLTKEMPFFENEDIEAYTIEEASLRIISLYHKEGYPYTQVANGIVEENEAVEIDFFIFEGEQYTISKIVFTGTTVDENRLMDILNVKEKAPFNPDAVEEDRDNMVFFYRALGFMDVRIDPFGIDINTLKKTISLHIHIEEGEQSKIKDIEIKGNHHIMDDEIMSSIKIEIGDPFNEVDIANARHRILSLYRNHGYTDATVHIRKEIIPPGVILSFSIGEGERYVFGKTIIKGNKTTDYRIFKRSFLHKQGEPYNYNLVLEERRRYYKTGLFRDVEIAVIEGENYAKDILIEVKEANPGVIEFGFGFAEDEGLRGFFDVRYKNIMRMNRQVGLRTEISRLEQRVSLNYIEPWFFNHPIPFKTTLAYQKTREENIDTGEVRYQVEKYSLRSGIEKRLSEWIKADLSYEFSLTKTFDVKPDVILSREDVGTLAISSVIPSLILDTRDNPFNPRNGFLGGVSLKAASFLLFSETDFLKLTGYLNYYKGFMKRLILALSLRSGIAQGLRDTTELPIVERFFLGGRTTVRGFPQDELGPKGEDGTPTGGNFFLIGNIELRTNIGKGIGVVTFFDTGNAWREFKEYDPTDLRYTAGIGIRYMTPVGPLRVDYGHKLDKEEGESSGEIHFSIGHAF